MRDPESYLLSRLRFRHLSVIAALAELRSIRKAARVLHLSEPAVSKALGEIEESFGFRLFERSAAGVEPTPQGLTVIEGATLLLNSLRHVRRSAIAAAGGFVVRIGAVPFISTTLLPRLLRHLGPVAVAGNAAPALQVALREGDAPSLLAGLHAGEIDVVLATLPPDVLPATAVELAFTPLFTEELTVIAPPGHRLARKRRVGGAELIAEPWILPVANSVTTVAVRAAFVAQGLRPPSAWIESSAVLASIEFVAAGLGLCAVPRALARAARRRGLVAELKVAPRIELPAVCFIHRAHEAQAPAVRRLREALVAAGLLGGAPGAGAGAAA